MIRPRSFHSYSSDIRCFVQHQQLSALPLEKITRQHLLTYQEHLLQKNKKGKTINGYLGNIKTLFFDMVKRGWLASQPFTDIPHIKEETSYQNRAFDEEQMANIQSLVAPKSTLGIAIQLMFYCFIRPSEIRGLQVQHFDLQNYQILIPASLSKNRKSEYVTMPLFLCDSLREFIGNQSSNQYVFSTNGGTSPIGRNTLSAQHRKVLEQLDYKEAHTLYSWKHTGVVTAYKKGIDLKSIQLQCRHHDISMTDTYLSTLGLYLNKAMMNQMPSWGKK